MQPKPSEMNPSPTEENRLILFALQPPAPLDHTATNKANEKILTYLKRNKKAPR